MASAYSPEQIDRYLEYIEIPSQYRRASNPPLDIDFLSTLHTYQLSRSPYENLSLHYSPSHFPSLDPQVLYQKIVGDARGRGGYCMENSIFFNHILRGLGFKAYTAGAKIRMRENGIPQGEYIGWVHIVNIVTIYTTVNSTTGEEQKQRYMIDVSFGGDGAIRPIPLIQEHVVQNLGAQEIQLVYDFIPSQTHRDLDEGAQKMWIYQYRNGQHLPWNSFYAFPELEFTPADFGVMNWYTGQSPSSFQTTTVLVIKFLRRPVVTGQADDTMETKNGRVTTLEEAGRVGQSEIYGKVMLVNGVVKRNLGGKTEVVKTCKTEAERIEALREYFGIELREEELTAIKGRVTDLDRPQGADQI